MKYKIVDFNKVLKTPELYARLRKLTLQPYSGMNTEMNSLKRLSEKRKVKAKVVLALTDDETIVAWVLLTKEESPMYTLSEPGVLSMTYVLPSFRRQGIASQMLKIAKRTSSPCRVTVVPWDDSSIGFFRTVKGIKSYYAVL